MKAIYEGDGYQLEWPYAVKAVRGFRIERKFNAHARCTFTAVMTEEEAEACLRRSSFEDSLALRKPAEPRAENWFAGGMTHVDIQMEDGIPLVQVEALSRTYAMDVQPRNRSYQNKHLTYTDAIAKLVADYPGGDAQNMATSEQAAIGSLMVQFEETDWQFMKRLASRVGTVILPDVVMDLPRVYFGVPDLSWGMELKAKRYTLMKDRAAYEELKAHAEGSEAEHIHEADFISYRILSGQYCQVGDNVQFKNHNISHPKTVYDPNVISNDQMIKWGKEAMEHGEIVGREIRGTASNGLKFTGYLDENGKVTNFFPTISE